MVLNQVIKNYQNYYGQKYSFFQGVFGKEKLLTSNQRKDGEL